MKKKKLLMFQVAIIYDKHHRGERPARTLPIKTVYNWAVSRTDLFKTHKDTSLSYKGEKA